MDIPDEVLGWARQCGLAVIAARLDGAVLSWNDAATELYQWNAREAVGRNILTLTPSLQSKTEAEAVMGRLRLGEPWHGEIVLRRRDGTPFRAFVADQPINHPQQTVILGISAVAKHRKAVLKAAEDLRAIV